ncbi:Uncharacterised protein [Sphingobacterium daejeonense]|nr:Uncharacterised protein [Sphingobacterium daejeonense]
MVQADLQISVSINNSFMVDYFFASSKILTVTCCPGLASSAETLQPAPEALYAITTSFSMAGWW